MKPNASRALGEVCAVVIFFYLAHVVLSTAIIGFYHCPNNSYNWTINMGNYSQCCRIGTSCLGSNLSLSNEGEMVIFFKIVDKLMPIFAILAVYWSIKRGLGLK